MNNLETLNCLINVRKYVDSMANMPKYRHFFKILPGIDSKIEKLLTMDFSGLEPEVQVNLEPKLDVLISKLDAVLSVKLDTIGSKLSETILLLEKIAYPVVKTSKFEDPEFEKTLEAFLDGSLEDGIKISIPFKPVVTEPLVTEPLVTEPLVTEPVVTEPVVTEPVVTEQVVTEQVVTEPIDVNRKYINDAFGQFYVGNDSSTDLVADSLQEYITVAPQVSEVEPIPEPTPEKKKRKPRNALKKLS